MYLRIHTNRKLFWITTQGTAQVNARIKGRTYYLDVSTLQAVVLLAFHAAGTHDCLAFAELNQRTGINEDVLKRLLHSLACNKKAMILTKTPVGNLIKETDMFGVNHTFTSPVARIKVPVGSLEQNETAKKVEENRSHAIDAAIVRIMKTRKSLKLHELESEVFKMLSLFQPTMKDIKRQIEHLMDREYLERDPDDQKLYRYIA